MPTRRSLIFGTASLAASLHACVAPTRAQRNEPIVLVPPVGAPSQVARDEVFWARVADQYRVTPAVTNLEAGYFGLMAQPVLAAFHRHIDRANRDSSLFARREFPALLETIRAQVAEFIGAKPTELAFSRNATEALQALIGQYNQVRAGDTVMYADLDYNAMQWAMNALAARRGATVAKLELPEQATDAAILQAYTHALDEHPRTKLLLVTHCNNKTGLIVPVRELVALARARGVDVVVDAAHSFGQVPLTLSGLDADFVGLNLHKWVGAPIGAGVLVIREGRLSAIDRAHADESAPATSIESRLHTGTTNFATLLTVPDALAFQQSIGLENKAARLRLLRDRWVHAVRGVPGVEVLTPDGPTQVGAISSFRLHGQTSTSANQAVVKTLFDEFGLFTQARTGLARGDCVRVTPALYSSLADADRLAQAVTTLAGRR